MNGISKLCGYSDADSTKHTDADELGAGVRNLYKYTKIYSGGEPDWEEGDVFRLTVPLITDAMENSAIEGRNPAIGVDVSAIEGQNSAIEVDNSAIEGQNSVIDADESTIAHDSRILDMINSAIENNNPELFMTAYHHSDWT